MEEPAVARTRLDESYGDYVRQRLDEEIRSRFSDADLSKRLKKIISNRVRGDEKFRVMSEPLQEALAEESLLRIPMMPITHSDAMSITGGA